MENDIYYYKKKRGKNKKQGRHAKHAKHAIEKDNKLINLKMLILLIVLCAIIFGVIKIINYSKENIKNINLINLYRKIHPIEEVGKVNNFENYKDEIEKEAYYIKSEIYEELILQADYTPPVIENIQEKDVYYIKVNNKANAVTIYKKDENGKFTIPYKAMICSTGTATPKSGVYNISTKNQWGYLKGGVYGQYCTRIVGSILFHSVPYVSQNKNDLEYWEYDKLGTTASAGCVRLTVEDALWIYTNCLDGTQVEFYSDSNPGPLGKPEAQKISGENKNIRCWDPTDPDQDNPWNL
ncbi:MAG: L,D-transpeptidase [Clostridia bacterium]|nr:L,D-transpeptidase [Clostridia bacterium]